MTIKLKKVFANLFYVITVLFLALVALDAPQSEMNVISQSEDAVTLTEFFTNSNLN